MWIALAILVFIAAQAYLFHWLVRLDRYLANPQWDEPKREVLSVAFSDPTTADSITEVLESFSTQYPKIDIVLLTGQNALDAVYDGRAAVGFLPADPEARKELNRLPIKLHTTGVLSSSGLHLVPLADDVEQELIWKRGARTSPAETFVRFLRDYNGADHGKPVGFMVS